jgi:hypothetical protein
VNNPALTIGPTCCAAIARLTDGREVYPNRPDLHSKSIWVCDACRAYVGCHPGGTLPLGTPAGPALRRARERLHTLRIDPLWRTADEAEGYEPEDDVARKKIRKAARSRIYSYLAAKLGITDMSLCHTGHFTLEQCRVAWYALSQDEPPRPIISYSVIRDWHRGTQKAERLAPAIFDGTDLRGCKLGNGFHADISRGQSEWHYQCLDHPRLWVIDKSWRKPSPGRGRTFVVDGEPYETLEEAALALKPSRLAKEEDAA